MSVLDDQYNSRLDDYVTTRCRWYIENIKISKNNLFAAFVVIAICALCLLFIPNSIAQMSLFQFFFDPTFAIKLGLLASIVLAFVSMFTSYTKMKNCLTEKALLQSEYALFNSRGTDNSRPNDEAAFAAFVLAVDGIMGANNHEVVIAMSKDNALKAKAQETSES